MGREIHDGEEVEACLGRGEALELMIVEEEVIEREAMALALRSQRPSNVLYCLRNKSEAQSYS